MALAPDKPKLVCAGMADAEEIAEALEAACEGGYKEPDWALLEVKE